MGTLNFERKTLNPDFQQKETKETKILTRRDASHEHAFSRKRTQNFLKKEKLKMKIQNLNQSLLTSAATAIIILILSLVTSSPTHAAQILIPLQTCGIAPAANRNLVLTPLQAAGGGAIPVMDKIQTNTDVNGNASVSLMPGVYQADVRPAWGQVGVTEFYFYVDPSNALQSAFTNLLTATNNTYPPNQYAYSAQASDARYAPLPVTSNDLASISPAQIYPPLPVAITNNQSGVTLGGAFGGAFTGNGSALTNVNAASVVPAPNTNLITVSTPLVAPVSSAGVEDISFQANLASNIPPSILASGYTSSSNNWLGTFTGNGSGLTGLTNINAAKLNGLSSSQYSLYASANQRGVLYYRTNWSNGGLSDFKMVTDNTNDFYVTNGGALILGTGDSYFVNYLLITNMVGGGIVDGENYSLTVNFQILGAPENNYTFFLGTETANPVWSINWFGSVSYYGFFQLAKINGTQNNTVTDSSFVIANGNNCNLTFYRRGDVIGLVAQNVASNYISSYFTRIGLTNNNPQPPPNTSYFAVHDTGGTPIQINSITVTDYTPTNSALAVVGDSVVEGEMSEYYQYRMASVLSKRLGTPTAICSGDGDRIFDISNDLPYILSLHPQTVLLRVGRNDFGLTNDWSPNGPLTYKGVVSSLTNAGISVWNLCSEPDTGSSSPYNTLNTFLMTNYPTTTIPVFNWNPNTMLSTDGTHPNPIGYQALADDAAAVMPIFANCYYADEYHPFDLTQLTNAAGYSGIITNVVGTTTNITTYAGGIVVSNLTF